MLALDVRTPISDLREMVRTLRAMERDGIVFSARRQNGTPSASDFVRLIPLGDKRYVVAAGHVVGLDTEAAELARELGDHVHERARFALELGDLATTANEFLIERTDGERLASMLLLLLDGRHNSFYLANAGHPEPMAVGRSGGVVALEGHGPVLGLLPGHAYRSSVPLRLGHGMIVMAGTKGLFETLDHADRPFGRERISKVLARRRDQGAKSVVREVLDAARRHAACSRDDDRAALAFQFDPD